MEFLTKTTAGHQFVLNCEDYEIGTKTRNDIHTLKFLL